MNVCVNFFPKRILHAHNYLVLLKSANKNVVSKIKKVKSTPCNFIIFKMLSVRVSRKFLFMYTVLNRARYSQLNVL